MTKGYFEAMAPPRILPPAYRSKLASGPAIAALGDEHAQLVDADQRFQAALDQAHLALRLGRVSFNPVKHIDPFGTILLPGL